MRARSTLDWSQSKIFLVHIYLVVCSFVSLSVCLFLLDFYPRYDPNADQFYSPSDSTKTRRRCVMADRFLSLM